VKWNKTGAIMSQYYKQMQRGGDDPRRMLEERLARKELGDVAYDKAASYHDDRAFKLFGVVFIVVMAVVIFGIAWMGY
jgi:hypothetical protein